MIRRVRDGAVAYLRVVALRLPWAVHAATRAASAGPAATRMKLLELRVARLERDKALMAAQLSALTTDLANAGGRPASQAVEAAWGSAIATYEHRIAALEAQAKRRRAFPSSRRPEVGP